MTDSELDYDSLLARAKENLPNVVAEHKRFQLPKLDIIYEGNNTIIRNFTDFSKAMRRDAEHFIGILQKELGTAGHLEGQRAVFKGVIEEGVINSRVEAYMETYVLCAECHRPDTHIKREGRTSVLVCEACGAKRPLMVKKSITTKKKKVLKEGEVYEMFVEDIGRKGDGVVKYGRYTIYVPGVSKGEKVKVRIQQIRGSLAFASVEASG